MKISLPYGKETIEVDVAETQLIAVLEPNDVPKCTDPIKAVKDAITNPEGAGSFSDFLSGSGQLLVIINDGTRPTPTRIVLEAIADELDEAGAEFIIATGVHRVPTEEEFSFIFGTLWPRFKDRVSVHDARADEMYRLGLTSRGTEVFLNTRVMDAERIMIIGSVEPHYFAGFTGGRKGFLPGVAAFSTIEQNHSLALSSKAKNLSLLGNPVHEDMLEACGMIDKKVYTIMTVLDRDQEIYAVAAGGLYAAFDKAVERSREVFIVPLAEKADVVVACVRPPMDIDLYQSHKAIENAKPALKNGGALILVSSCRDGIGEAAFCNLLSSCSSPEAVFKKIAKGYKLGHHKAAKIAELCGKARVMAYTKLDDSTLENIFIEPVVNLQETLDELLSVTDSRIIFLPDASVTVPMTE
ncbi:MAG: nickel-dependent lactate racemase [Spirochaetales bacterium]|nr:nickel-dependent lactate racemase [Spirochaetales bacterium]